MVRVEGWIDVDQINRLVTDVPPKDVKVVSVIENVRTPVCQSPPPTRRAKVVPTRSGIRDERSIAPGYGLPALSGANRPGKTGPDGCRDRVVEPGNRPLPHRSEGRRNGGCSPDSLPPSSAPHGAVAVFGPIAGLQASSPHVPRPFAVAPSTRREPRTDRDRRSDPRPCAARRNPPSCSEGCGSACRRRSESKSRKARRRHRRADKRLPDQKRREPQWFKEP